MFTSIRNNAIFNGFSQPQSVEEIRAKIKANSDLHVKNVRERIKKEKSKPIEKAVEEPKEKPEVKKENLIMNEDRLKTKFNRAKDGSYSIESKDIDIIVKSLIFSADSMDLKKKVSSEEFRELITASKKTKRPFFVKANDTNFQFNFIEK